MSRFVKNARYMESKAGKKIQNDRRMVNRLVNQGKRMDKEIEKQYERLMKDLTPDDSDINMVGVYKNFINKCEEIVDKVIKNSESEEVIDDAEYTLKLAKSMFDYNIILDVENMEISNLPLDELQKKASDKLANHEIDFHNPNNIELKLRQSRIDYDYKRYIDDFLRIFFSFVVNNDIDKNSYFIGEVLKNIIHVNTKPDPELNKLTLDNVKSIIDIYLNKTIE